MEPDKELERVWMEWWWAEKVAPTETTEDTAKVDLADLLEHLHSHGWAVVRRLGGTNG